MILNDRITFRGNVQGLFYYFFFFSTLMCNLVGFFLLFAKYIWIIFMCKKILFPRTDFVENQTCSNIQTIWFAYSSVTYPGAFEIVQYPQIMINKMYKLYSKLLMNNFFFFCKIPATRPVKIDKIGIIRLKTISDFF